MTKLLTLLLLLLLTGFFQKGQAQENANTQQFLDIDALDQKPIDPLAPSRAAFYSAIVPGMGQVFNKKYWKVPLVYAAIGVPLYFSIDNHKKYTEYRDEYKKRLRGIVNTDDPIFGRLDNDRIIEGQRFYQKNRDLSIIIVAGFYVLSIIDANVDAHLMQFNVNDNLSIQPAFELNPQNFNNYQYAINLRYSF